MPKLLHPGPGLNYRLIAEDGLSIFSKYQNSQESLAGTAFLKANQEEFLRFLSPLLGLTLKMKVNTVCDLVTHSYRLVYSVKNVSVSTVKFCSTQGNIYRHIKHVRILMFKKIYVDTVNVYSLLTKIRSNKNKKIVRILRVEKQQQIHFDNN